MLKPRLPMVGAAAIVAGAALVLGTAAAGTAAPGDPLPGRCDPGTLAIAVGIGVTCEVIEGAGGPAAPGTVVHTAALDLTAPGVVPFVVQSNDLVFQPMGPEAGIDPYATNETVTSMANRTGAVIGVNGGYFDNDKGPLVNTGQGTPQPYTGSPCGGVVVDGRILKSPPNSPALNASAFVLPDGTLGIGHVGFVGEIRIGDDAGTVVPLDSINTLGDGVPQPGCPKLFTSPTTGAGVTMLTADMGEVILNESYDLSPGSQYRVLASSEPLLITAVRTGGDDYVVDGVTTPAGFDGLPALATDRIMLVASQVGTPGSIGERLRSSVDVGTLLSIPTALTMADPAEPVAIEQLVSGVAVIVEGGAAVSPEAVQGYVPDGRNAETMLGIDAASTAAVLSVVDDAEGVNTTGDAIDSPGVTWQEAAAVMVARGVETALLFDGGGSSTLVAQLDAPSVTAHGESSRTTVINSQDGANNFPEGAFNQRLVGDGLFFLGDPVPPALPPTGGRDAATATAGGIVAGVLGTALIAAGALARRRSRTDRVAA